MKVVFSLLFVLVLTAAGFGAGAAGEDPGNPVLVRGEAFRDRLEYVAVLDALQPVRRPCCHAVVRAVDRASEAGEDVLFRLPSRTDGSRILRRKRRRIGRAEKPKRRERQRRLKRTGAAKLMLPRPSEGGIGGKGEARRTIASAA